jgi:hypothetical protein
MWTLIAAPILSYRRESNKQPTRREEGKMVNAKGEGRRADASTPTSPFPFPFRPRLSPFFSRLVRENGCAFAGAGRNLAALSLIQYYTKTASGGLGRTPGDYASGVYLIST